MLERSTRQKHILKKIDAFFVKKIILNLINDSSLLKRISNSVEFPNVYFGSFDNKFFKIPEFLFEKYYVRQTKIILFLKKKIINFLTFLDLYLESRLKNIINLLKET